MTARLATEEVRPREGREADRWAWFLHGIYGRGRNWRSVARRLVDAVPGLGGRLVDLRLHGGSTDASPPHTLKACAADLAELAAPSGVAAPDVLLGHSFGGKVALETARRRPEGIDDMDQVWVVDASPSPSEPGGEAVRMLSALREEPGPFASRDEAVGALEARGFARPVARWMATNLEEGDGGFRWALDPDAVGELLEDFFRTDCWDVVASPPDGLELHVVKAEDADVLPEEECRRVEAAGREHGRAELHRLPGGHWLNVSNPDGLLDLLQGRMTR